jgi:DNA-binding CsgD family transcriptional regulator
MRRPHFYKGVVVMAKHAVEERLVAGFYVRVGMSLSPRDAQILRLLADGATSEGIGAALKISKRTVDVYRCRLQAKLGALTTAHAVSLAYQKGLLTVEPRRAEESV